MCFSPKMKVPKQDTAAVRAVEPAPLTETPSGVVFGGSDEDNSTSSEVATGSSKDAAKVTLDSKKTTESKKTNSGVKKSISSKAFGK